MGVLRRIFSRFLLKGAKLVSKPNVLCIFVSDVGLRVLLSPRAQNAGYGTLGLLCVVSCVGVVSVVERTAKMVVRCIFCVDCPCVFLIFSSFFLLEPLNRSVATFDVLPTILFLDVAFLLQFLERLVDQLVSTLYVRLFLLTIHT